MPPKSPYRYKTFSSRIGNLSGLKKYVDDIALFYTKYFPEIHLNEELSSITSSIENEWSGAVLAFDGSKTIGFMDFTHGKDRRVFMVGFAYVDSDYWNKKVWTTMSALVEDEVRQMGGEQLNREINPGNELLVAHLRKHGYNLFPRIDELDYYPMAKRL